MDNSRAPLYERLLAHQARYPSSFHVPGHKNGTVLPEDVAEIRPLMALDYTEITGLDDLTQPEGVIREAEQLAAACYGADRTFFLVQGSTLGNMACILGVCDPGDLILVDRFIHKSVLNSLMLAHAQAVFLTPIWDPDTGYASGIDEQSLAEAIRSYPHARAIFITRPNYFGQAADLTRVIQIAHEANIPVIIDEAHGAHFSFHEATPRSAISYGADAVVQSSHKMLAALTMGAMLHLRGEMISMERIERAIRMLQTSSPSYPIMASLDVARSLMHTAGREWVERGLLAVRLFEQEMAHMPWFILPSTHHKRVDADHSTIAQDPFKQPVRDGTGTVSGYQLQGLLEEQGCMVEMADAHHVLLVFSPFSETQDVRRIVEIFRLISTRHDLDKKELTDHVSNISVSPIIPTSTEPVAFTRHMIDHRDVIEVPLTASTGEYSADMITPYPPGIPFVYPGERIDGKIVAALQKMVSMGARFQGGVDSSLSKIRVQRRRQEPERMT